MIAVANESFRLVPDWTLLPQTAVFLAVVVGLSVLVFRPVRKIIQRRREFTIEAKADAEVLAEEALQLAIGRDEVLAMVLTEAQVDRDKKLAAAYREADRMTAEARENARKVLSANAVTVEAMKKSLEQDAGVHAADIAESIVDRILK
ncbi:MAG: ATP synthase F0 subunit B [bacterium]